jgi:hypothetical protein
MGMADNIFEALLPVVPEEWFAAFEVEAATAFAVEGVDRSDSFREIQVQRSASIHPAMPAPQVAAVGEDQPADQRRGLPKHLVADHISQTVRTGFQHGTDVHGPHRGDPLGG